MLRNSFVLCVILLLASVLRAGLNQFVRSHPARAISPDSELYLQLGRDFQKAYIESDPELLHDSVLRTPLYPLFCAICFAVAYDGIVPVVIAQIGVSIACIVITWLVAKELFNARVAGWSALFLALDPLTATYANYVRNEMLFTLLLVAGVLLWFRSLRRPGALTPWFAGLILGLSVLARPVSTYLLLPLLPIGFFTKRASVPERLGHAILLAVGFMIPVGGWIARNYSLTGGILVSSIEGQDLLYFRAAGAIAEEVGKKRWDVADQLKESLVTRYGEVENPARLSDLQKAEAIRLLRKHPRGAILSAAKGAATLLGGPGQEALFRLVGIAREKPSVVTIRKWIRGIQFGYLAILYFAAVIGIVALCRHRAFSPLVGLVALILYFTVACAGPEGYSRYRVPIMPFFCVLAGCGVGLARPSAVSGPVRPPVSPRGLPGRPQRIQPDSFRGRKSSSPKRPPFNFS